MNKLAKPLTEARLKLFNNLELSEESIRMFKLINELKNSPTEQSVREFLFLYKQDIRTMSIVDVTEYTIYLNILKAIQHDKALTAEMYKRCLEINKIDYAIPSKLFVVSNVTELLEFLLLQNWNEKEEHLVLIMDKETPPKQLEYIHLLPNFPTVITNHLTGDWSDGKIKDNPIAYEVLSNSSVQTMFGYVTINFTRESYSKYVNHPGGDLTRRLKDVRTK